MCPPLDIVPVREEVLLNPDVLCARCSADLASPEGSLPSGPVFCNSSTRFSELEDLVSEKMLAL